MPTSVTPDWLKLLQVLHKIGSINELDDVDIHFGMENDWVFSLKENMLRILEYIFV